MDLDTYRQLRDRARRLVPADDADDLVQDTLLAALHAGRGDIAWLTGVLQHQAAMLARTAVRRRRREQAIDASPEDAAPRVDTSLALAELLQRLPPSARRVAVLALHGLDAEEIRWILGIAPTAFRQRLTRIRQAIGTLPPALQAEAIALAYVRDPARAADLQFGLVRRALKAALRAGDGLAAHDADGHLFVLSPRAHTSPSRGN